MRWKNLGRTMNESILVDSPRYEYVGSRRDWAGHPRLVACVSVTKEFLNG